MENEEDEEEDEDLEAEVTTYNTEVRQNHQFELRQNINQQFASFLEFDIDLDKVQTVACNPNIEEEQTRSRIQSSLLPPKSQNVSGLQRKSQKRKQS